MDQDEKYINMAMQLGKQGIGSVSPNPMVGCVIVYKDQIVGQGFHEYYGGPHAELNAINDIEDKSLLKDCTLYVNLEPCSHHGKTPPCADLIIENKIPKVVIGCIDSFSEVSGRGIEKLKAAGTDVRVGVLKSKALELNKRFFNYHDKKRPYVILKWAKTADGFIDVDRNNTAHIEQLKKEADQKNDGKSYNWITTDESKKLVHHWRTEVQAIMVGTNTAANDNPQLTVREVQGKNPIRVILDLNLRLPKSLRVFDGSSLTIVINYTKEEKIGNLDFVKVDKNEDLIAQILSVLYRYNVQSVLIEGGSQLLQSFIASNLWDEARVFTGTKEFKNGLLAPKLDRTPNTLLTFGDDHLEFIMND